jgi:hypothetical protein
MAKHFIQGRWWTELGRQIKMNDLLNDIKRHLKALKELQRPKKGSK